MIADKFTFISLRRVLLIWLVASIPALTCILLISSQANMLSFTPVWSDEIFYWHGILTFKIAGFQGGYYTLNEAAAAAQFTHFYTYGPWFSVIYGTFAKLLGWERVTFILFNMISVTLALVAFCRIAQIEGRQLFVLGLSLSSFWCLITYLPTAMQEAFQQTIAILIAAVLFRAFKKREKMGWVEYVYSILLLSLATLLRISWSIMIFPFLLQTSRPRLLWRTAGVISGGIILIAIYFFAQYTGSQGNNSVTGIINKFSVSFDAGWSYFSAHFTDNLNQYLDVKKQPLDALQSVQVLVLGIVALLVVVVQALRKRYSIEAAFHSYNIFAIIGASCALYIFGTWGDYRVIGTHLMVSLLLLVAYKRYLPIQIFVLSNVLVIPAFIGFFQPQVISKYQIDDVPIDKLHISMDAFAPYRPDAPNGWCNTLLFPVETFSPYLLATSGGVGLSFFDDTQSVNYRSQYLLLNQSRYDALLTKPNAPVLESLLDTPLGTLYLNHSSDCPVESD